MDKETENKGGVFVNSDYAVDSCGESSNTKETHTMSTNRYDFCCTGSISSDTSTYKVFISNNIEDTLKIYDKTLRFNGYQEDMDGKWYRVNEDGLSVYYFERDKGEI